MSRPQINLGDLGGELQSAIEAAPPNPLDDLMSAALEAERGIGIECKDAAAAARKRFQFYKRRRQLQDIGVHSFDKLVILSEGNLLKLMREPDVKVFEL